MSDLWVPGMPMNGRRQRQAVVKPFAQLGKQVKKMGFDCGLQHDAKERSMRVRFRPTTERTKQACISAGGDGEGLEVAVNYDEGDSPGTVALACIEKGLEVLEQIA